MDKQVYIKFTNGDEFSIDAEFIANMRTEYYSTVDGFEKGSQEWDEEFKVSMNDSELIDWIQNNINWSDIENEVTKIVKKEYDYDSKFYKCDFKIVD